MMINSYKKGEPTKLLQGSLIYSQYKIEDIHSITQQYYLTDYKGYHCRGKSLTAMTDQLV